MAFEVRDLMMDVFPSGAQRGFEMRACTPASPTLEPADLPEEEPCIAPSCVNTVQPEEEPDSGEPTEPSGLAMLQQQLREALSSPAAGAAQR